MSHIFVNKRGITKQISAKFNTPLLIKSNNSNWILTKQVIWFIQHIFKNLPIFWHSLLLGRPTWNVNDKSKIYMVHAYHMNCSPIGTKNVSCKFYDKSTHDSFHACPSNEKLSNINKIIRSWRRYVLGGGKVMNK